ncbi:energy transducer TonB [Terrihabitans sp. B22-R8]|uniref:energy transducer TonB n=1 Tax=Terrihabitans sp. B22-R8 TaxID=3425128 RepID=UPI00403C3B17
MKMFIAKVGVLSALLLGMAATPASAASDLDRYGDSVRSAIVANVHYPKVARAGGQVRYSFVLTRNGSIRDVRVFGGMKQALEKGFIDIVVSTKFPPVPASLDAPIRFHGTMVFNDPREAPRPVRPR